jgi:hypothetical protein
MEHGCLARNPVHGCMDEHGSRLNGMAPCERLPMLIDQYDVVGLNLAPEQAPGVDQKTVGVVRQAQAEVVADPLSEPMMKGGPEREGQISPQGLNAGLRPEGKRFSAKVVRGKHRSAAYFK